MNARDSLVFSKRCSKQVKHEFHDEIPGHKIPCYKPDTVFGLKVTGWMKNYIQKLPDIKHTPFGKLSDIAYPFFICEAKSGVQNISFDKINLQTAFPTRSCLILQKRLREASNNELNPLVWYMPYSGDVWKLSACVMQGDEVVSMK